MGADVARRTGRDADPSPSEGRTRARGLGDLALDAYYAAKRLAPPDPVRYVLEQPGWLPQGGVVLDFGGGEGRLAVALASARKVTVTVADIDGEALARVPANPRVRTAHLVDRTLPFPDGAFDLVFAHHVLHHVHDLGGIVTDLKRVVRIGGRIVCVEFRPSCPVTWVFRLLSLVRRLHCTFYHPEALADRLAGSSFDIGVRLLDGCQYVVCARRLT